MKIFVLILAFLISAPAICDPSEESRIVVDLINSKKYSSALSKLLPRVKKGNAAAQYYYANVFFFGGGGFDHYWQYKAAYWGLRSAEQGVAEAYTLLGYLVADNSYYPDLNNRGDCVGIDLYAQQETDEICVNVFVPGSRRLAYALLKHAEKNGSKRAASAVNELIADISENDKRLGDALIVEVSNKSGLRNVLKKFYFRNEMNFLFE